MLLFIFENNDIINEVNDRLKLNLICDFIDRYNEIKV